jgi:hypothetical protein
MKHTLLAFSRWSGVTGTVVGFALFAGCVEPPESSTDRAGANTSSVAAEVEAAVWAFHAADTARDAESIVGLLWPEYSMFVDGARSGYDEVVVGAREFMPSLRLFHTDWTDVQITPLGADVAVASFQFRDSIITLSNELIRSRGPTTLIWQRRDGEWRLLYGDSDHYSIDP